MKRTYKMKKKDMTKYLEGFIQEYEPEDETMLIVKIKTSKKKREKTYYCRNLNGLGYCWESGKDMYYNWEVHDFIDYIFLVHGNPGVLYVGY